MLADNKFTLAFLSQALCWVFFELVLIMLESNMRRQLSRCHVVGRVIDVRTCYHLLPLQLMFSVSMGGVVLAMTSVREVEQLRRGGGGAYHWGEWY